ncbi:MAG: SDR family oxidoreductase [Solirubrobacterales bacterium]|nr:SDR family oxidoreductase [Solirubrobacterales bacterium]
MIDRNVLVTGGSQGIGRAVALELAAQGARLTLVARGAEALEQTLAELPGKGHQAHALDVAEPDGWERLMSGLAGPLHGVVSAAGVLGPIGRIDQIDPAEFSQALAVNLTGTVLALRHTLARLEQGSGRFVAFSGGGATGPLARYDAYALSKVGVVRLVENVAATTTVEINAVAPGFVATRMHQGTLAAGPDQAGADYYARTARDVERGGVSPALAAELCAFLLSDAAAGISGRLISAQWDPWREPEFQERLRSDPALGRLRRIDGQFFAGL